MSQWQWSAPERRLLVSGLCGVILAAAGAAFGAEDTFDGVYIGKRVRVSGPAEACPEEGEVSVKIQGEIMAATVGNYESFPFIFSPGSDGSFSRTFIQGTRVITYRGRIKEGIPDIDLGYKPCRTIGI